MTTVTDDLNCIQNLPVQNTYLDSSKLANTAIISRDHTVYDRVRSTTVAVSPYIL